MTDNSAADPDAVVKHRKQLLGAVDFSMWPDRLKPFLKKNLAISGDIEIGDTHLPSAGGSSGTLMFSASFDRDGHRTTEHYVLRYATEGGLFHSYNLPGQYAILKGLQGKGVPVPGVVGIDENGAMLGVTGYVMRRVDANVSPSAYHKSGLMFDASPENRRKMVFDVIASLAKLHALDWRTLGVDFLLKRGQGNTAIERDLDWYWSSLRWACPGEMAGLDPMRRWLLAHQPAEAGICLNHGDSMLANYMFKDNRVAAILDWELALLGNPANDIVWQAYTNAFLALGSTPLPGIPSEQEWKAEYERVSGRPLADWNYFCALNAFKLHLTLLLVYRNPTPELEAAALAVRQYNGQRLADALARCGYSAG